MIIKTKKLTFKKSIATIGFTSCWHVGNPMCREEKIIEMLKRWKKNKTPWFNLGDTIEAVTPTDPRFHAETHEKSISCQLAEAAHLAKIAKDQMVGSVIGNHEDKLAKYYGCATRDFLQRVYNDNTVAEERWLSACAIITFECPKGSLDVFVAHSKLSVGGGTSDPDRDKINRQIKLRRRLGAFEADLKVVGHGHRVVISPPLVDRALCSKEGEPFQYQKTLKPEWCAMCPSMFASYDSTGYPSYAEMALLPPQDIGYLEADVDKEGTVLEVRAM